MPSPSRHDHRFRVISHHMDWSKVLVMCASNPCVETQVWTTKTHRVKLAERKYRDQSITEFLADIRKLEHLCCEAA